MNVRRFLAAFSAHLRYAFLSTSLKTKELHLTSETPCFILRWYFFFNLTSKEQSLVPSLALAQCCRLCSSWLMPGVLHAVISCCTLVLRQVGAHLHRRAPSCHHCHRAAPGRFFLVGLRIWMWDSRKPSAHLLNCFIMGFFSVQKHKRCNTWQRVFKCCIPPDYNRLLNTGVSFPQYNNII